MGRGRPYRMNILLIEDETKLAASLAKGLSAEGWQVSIAGDGLDGLHRALEGAFDLIILDRMLPGLDGVALLSALRSKKRTPVLMLTALGDVEDRVSGLRAGADDYLAKPFSFSELIARAEALVRRAQGTDDQPLEDNTLSLADLVMDLPARRVHRGDTRLQLTAKEFRFLELLLRRQGRVLSRHEIAEKVWDMNFDGDMNVVEVAVRRLRTKIDVPFERKLLHTVRGMGYILEDRSA